VADLFEKIARALFPKPDNFEDLPSFQISEFHKTICPECDNLYMYKTGKKYPCPWCDERHER